MTDPKAPFGLRMPVELHDWIASRAEENGRSKNSEILQILKAVRQAEQRQQHAA